MGQWIKSDFVFLGAAVLVSLLFASVARRTLTSFVAASAWAARPGASGSPAGSSEQFFGELRAAGVFGLLRALLAQVSAFGSSVCHRPAYWIHSVIGV